MRSRRRSLRIRRAGCLCAELGFGALQHGRHITSLAGDHRLRVPVGAGRARVRPRPAPRSRPLPRVVELRVHRRRRVDQRGRPARADAQGLLPGRNQESPRNRGGRPGYVDVAPRRPRAHGRQPAVARESQGEEADIAPAPPAGVPAENIHALPGGPRLPVARGCRLSCRAGSARAGASPRHRNGARRAAGNCRSAHPPQRGHAGSHAARPPDGQGVEPRHGGSGHSPVAARPARGRLPARRAAARRSQLPGLGGPPRGDRRRAGTGQDLRHLPVGRGRRARGVPTCGPPRVPDPARRSARRDSCGQGVHRARARPGARLRAPRRLPAIRPLARRTGRRPRCRYPPPPAPPDRRGRAIRTCEAPGPPCAVAPEHPGGRPGSGAAAAADLQLADRGA